MILYADLDHTADVQLHGWGSDLKQAFEQVALCMFNYMTPLEGIEAKTMREYVMKGHDMESMMYHWLDELLFGFSTELFVPKRIEINKFDREGWNIEARGCVARCLFEIVRTQIFCVE